MIRRLFFRLQKKFLLICALSIQSFPLQLSALPSSINTVPTAQALESGRDAPKFQFSGTSNSEIILVNPASKELAYLLLDKSKISQGGWLSLSWPFSSDWQVVGMGDFDSNGSPDIIAQNSKNLSLVLISIADMAVSNTTNLYFNSEFYPAAAVGMQFESISKATSSRLLVRAPSPVPTSGPMRKIAVAVGDFMGNGKPRILFIDIFSRQLSSYAVAGSSLTDPRVVSSNIIDSKREVVAAGDLNGDGTADVLLRNKNSGDFSYWLLKNGALKEVGALDGISSTTHKVLGIGDIEENGYTDIMVQDPSTRQLSYWVLDGLKKVRLGITTRGTPDWYLNTDVRAASFIANPGPALSPSGWPKAHGDIINSGRAGSEGPLTPNFVFAFGGGI